MIGPLRLDRISFRDASGAPVAVGRITVERVLKSEPGQPRQVYLVRLDQSQALLKVQRSGLLNDRGYLPREARMLNLAAQRGLSVPKVLGGGVERLFAMVRARALLLEWIDSVRPLHAAAPNPSGRQVLVETYRQVRRAGLADKDFGAHNLLVDDDLAAMWVDLERAYEAEPGDADATMRTCGSALASWWIATQGDQGELQACFDDLRRHEPQPRGGWRSILDATNAYMQKKVAALIERGWIDRPPQPLTLS